MTLWDVYVAGVAIGSFIALGAGVVWAVTLVPEIPTESLGERPKPPGGSGGMTTDLIFHWTEPKTPLRWERLK